MSKKAKVQNRSTKSDLTVTEIPAACSDELAAVEFLERHRWGKHPACPHCAVTDVYQMTGRDGGREKHYRWRCRSCKQQFSVRTGTVFEDSRIPLRHWNYAFWRASTSKKGVSALEIKRQTGLSYKSALFLLHRIRYAMAPATAAEGPLSGTVEADETYVGGKPRYRQRRTEGQPYETKPKTGRGTDKQPVFAVVQRGGPVCARVVADVTARSLKGVIREAVANDARIITDQFQAYRGLADEFLGGHETVNHASREYARGDVHTNTVEGFFSLLKRSIYGIHHAVSREHLHRYVAHVAFLYNNRELEDGERLVATIRAAQGKRLMYAEPD